jgi:hypothetical protein
VPRHLHALSPRPHVFLYRYLQKHLQYSQIVLSFYSVVFTHLSGSSIVLSNTKYINSMCLELHPKNEVNSRHYGGWGQFLKMSKNEISTNAQILKLKIASKSTLVGRGVYVSRFIFLEINIHLFCPMILSKTNLYR